LLVAVCQPNTAVSTPTQYPSPAAAIAVQENAKKTLMRALAPATSPLSHCLLGVAISKRAVSRSSNKAIQDSDHLLSFGATEFDSDGATLDDLVKATEAVPANSVVSMKINRKGERRSIQIQCQDSKAYNDRKIEAYYAAAHADFAGCVQKFDDAEKIVSLTSHDRAFRFDCVKVLGRYSTGALNIEYYNIKLQEISESRFSAKQLDDIRASILKGVDFLNAQGEHTLADDLRNRFDQDVTIANQP